MTQEFVIIGKIVAPHGVRGDVRVAVLTDFPDRFETLKTVHLDTGEVLEVVDVRFHKQFVLLRFAKLESMNAVEHLRGKLLRVKREDAVVLPEGHYYFFDIIGLTVYTIAGECLGNITDIISTGANDVYVVDRKNGKSTLVPALKKVVRQIDIVNKKMVVELLEEWDGEEENEG